MSDPTYYDFLQRTHGYYLNDGVYNELVNYEYYAGDELHTNNVVFKDTPYITFDNTHVRFLNKSDIHLYDTSGINIYDSGTFTMHTSASPNARAFVIDSIGRVGIGMVHSDPHSSPVEKPGFDLHVRGTVGIEDYMYHNDDTDTYMLFGSDQNAHNVNLDGVPDLAHLNQPNPDSDEINFRVGGVDMLQMIESDSGNYVTVNKNQGTVGTVVKTETNEGALVVRGDGTEIVVNDTEQSDTNFRVKSSGTADIPEGHGPHEKSHAFFVETETGRVGIGKSSPDTTLHVAGSAHIEGDLWVKGVTNQIDTLVHVTSAMDITNMGTGPALIVNQTGTQPVATFQDDGQDVLYIEDLGNVGFQTNDPHTSVYISDHDGIRIPIGTTDQRPKPSDYNITILNDDPSNFDEGIEQSEPMLGTVRYNTEYQTFEGFGPGNAWGSLGGVIDIDRDTFWTALNDISGSDYPGDPDQLRAFVGNDNNPNTTNGTLMMTIDLNRTVVHRGKMGICTNYPEWPLDVNGDARLGDWYSKVFSDHNDHKYSTNDYYMLLLEYDTGSYVSGRIQGFRGSATEANRNLDFGVHLNSTSYPSDSVGDMFVQQLPGAHNNPNSLGGFNKVEYDGKDYVAIKIESGTQYHAMAWEFIGRAKFETTTNQDNFLRICRDDQVTWKENVKDYVKIDHNLYRKGLKFGIGTTEPQELLTIRGSSTLDQTSIRTSFGGVNEDQYFTLWKAAAGFKVHRAKGTSGNLMIGITTPDDSAFNSTGGHIAFNTNSAGTYAERVRITRDGDVGIGTMSPISRLHVNESVNTKNTGLTISNYDNTAGTNQAIRLDFGLARNSGALKPYAGRILVGKEDDWVSDDKEINSFMSFNVFEENAISEKMRITSSGNVGISTDAPKSRLHIPQPSTTIGGNDITKGVILVGDENLGIGIDNNEIIHTGNMLNIGTYINDVQNVDSNSGAIRFNPNKVEAMRIIEGGNVGIGTATPDHKLTIQTDSTSGLELVGQNGANQNSNSSKIIFNGFAQDNGPFIQAINVDGHGKKRLGFFVGRSASDYTTLPTESMSIINNGRVGIGIISPSQPLDVNGSIRAQTGWFRNAQDETGLYNEANQNHFHSSAVDTWTMNAKTGSDNLYLQLKTGGYSGTTRGYLAGTHAGVGILDDDKNWAIMAITDDSVKLRVNNADVFTAGINQVSGSYGTVQTHGSGKNNWEGYSINGRAVFMHNGGTETGIYNDVDNQWMLKAFNAGKTGLYHAGVEKLATMSTGIDVTGVIQLNDGSTTIAEGAGNAVRIKTAEGYVDIGPQNSGHCHIYTDRSNFYFNKTDLRAAGHTMWHAGNDGSGSGLDADKVDGLQASQFLRNDADQQITNYGHQTRWYSNTTIESNASNQASLEVFQPTAGADAFMTFHVGGDFAAYFGLDGSTNDLSFGGWSKGANKYQVWHAGNDGTGSGLDADKVDGLHASSFARSDADDTVTGLLTINRAAECLRLQGNGSTTSPHLSLYQSSTRRAYIQFNNGTKCIHIYNDYYDDYLKLGGDASGLRWNHNGTNSVVWHSGNDGTNSGLDADLLDGLHASSFHQKGENIDVGAAISANNVEGGEISIRTTTGLTPYYVDAYRDANNVYKHGAGKWLFRIFRESGALTFDSDTSTLRNMGDIVAYNSSDSKYKDNLTPIPDALNKTLSLTGYEFDWNDKQTTYTGHDVGVVAQEVEKVLPEIVETRADESKAVKYEKMIPLLIESIKEQQLQIDTLKAEIDRLKQQ